MTSSEAFSFRVLIQTTNTPYSISCSTKAICALDHFIFCIFLYPQRDGLQDQYLMGEFYLLKPFITEISIFMWDKVLMIWMIVGMSKVYKQHTKSTWPDKMCCWNYSPTKESKKSMHNLNVTLCLIKNLI